MILFLIYIIYIFSYYNTLNYYIVFLGGGIFFIAYIYLIYFYHKKSYKINDKEIPKKILNLELKNNIYSFIIYTFIIILLFSLYEKDYFNFSFEVSLLVIPYSILLVIFHDTYFYFLHRLIHTKIGYKYIHIDHHKSVFPSVLSAYNFHPIEAILYAFAIIPIFFIDLNFYAFLFAIFFNDLLNFLGHSGYELFKNKPNNLFFRYFVLTTYHDLHHSKNKGNYGLYFSWWDRLLGTYDSTYDKII